jgi:YopX protein
MTDNRPYVPTTEEMIRDADISLEQLKLEMDKTTIDKHTAKALISKASAALIALQGSKKKIEEKNNEIMLFDAKERSLESPADPREKPPMMYRIWDTLENKLWEPTYQSAYGKLEDLTLSRTGQLVRRTLQMPAEIGPDVESRYLVQLYAGRKDSYGEHLYAGDILKMYSQLSEEFLLAGAVTFRDGCFGIDTDWKNSGFKGQKFLPFNPKMASTMKVGTIQEDVHILEGNL